MSGAQVDRLEALARADAVVAPLARLQAAALQIALDPQWSQALSREQVLVIPDEPLLHRQRLVLAPHIVAAALHALLDVAIQADIDGALAVRDALHTGAIDPFALIQAGMVVDASQFAQLARRAQVAPELLTTLGQVLALPLLHACGEVLASRTATRDWTVGYCSVCGAWPALAELRGLERERWLRCGRCGSAWQFPHQRCVFCGNDDFRTLHYLAPEGQQDALRAECCQRCRGYLKTVATLGALSHEAVLVRDLATLELDLAALDQQYQRTRVLGFPLVVHLVARD